MVKFFLIIFFLGYINCECNLNKTVEPVYYFEGVQDSLSNGQHTLKWTKRDVTWCLHFNEEIRHIFHVLEEDIEEAFKEWSFYINLRFIRIRCQINLKEADMNFGMQHMLTNFFNLYISKEYVLGLAEYPSQNYDNNKISALFNLNRTWDIGIKKLFSGEKIRNNSNVLFYGTVLHEIGHNLGLEHLSSTCALMNAIYRGGMELYPNDVIHALNLYEPNQYGNDGRSYRETKNNISPKNLRYPIRDSKYKYRKPVFIPKPDYKPNSIPLPNPEPNPDPNPDPEPIPETNPLPEYNPETDYIPNPSDNISKKYLNNNMDYVNVPENKYNDILTNSHGLKYFKLSEDLYYIYNVFGRNLKHPFILNKNDKKYLSFI